MTKTRTDAWLRRAGLATGFVVALVALVGLRVPHGSGRLGLDLQMAATQTGELQAAPLAPFVSVSGLERGDSRTGSFTLRNETGAAQSVRLRASANLRDADRSLRLRIEAGSERVFDGPLGNLRRATATRPFVVPRAATRRVEVTALVPDSAPAGYAGRILDVQLAPVVEAAR